MANALGLNALGLHLQRALLSPFVRAVNYHDVAPYQADAFETQLIYYKAQFDILGPAGLEGLLSGHWDRPRPGLVLTFDDGLRSHADIVAPLLERHDLTGWFMVPIGFLDEPPDAQLRYAHDHRIPHYQRTDGDPRVGMTWDNVRHLAERHEIGCHTWEHRQLGNWLSAVDLEAEIPKAKLRLESEIGRPVRTFCWVGGEEASYSREAASVIGAAGFRFSFMTNNQVIRPGHDPLQLQRTNIEARDPATVVRFQLSGAMDLLYSPKRWRVNRLTSLAGI
jgi:peptidoglycan/xylan/chitin deacetylase (PgdA/CDA1 family)